MLRRPESGSGRHDLCIPAGAWIGGGGGPAKFKLSACTIRAKVAAQIQAAYSVNKTFLVSHQKPEQMPQEAAKQRQWDQWDRFPHRSDCGQLTCLRSELLCEWSSLCVFFEATKTGFL